MGVTWIYPRNGEPGVPLLCNADFMKGSVTVGRELRQQNPGDKLSGARSSREHNI